MSLDDGPGIRTTVFVKGCPLHCLWCHNPECVDREGTVQFHGYFKKAFLYQDEAEELCKRLQRDRPLYEATGGGVTISGGEPLLYPEAVSRIGTILKREGISLAVDTCGFVPWQNFEQVLPVTELVLYDLKAAGEQRHRELTGKSNVLIWENFHRLLEEGTELLIRIPVIGGANENELMELVGKIPARANIKAVEFLPYHRYGVGKYEKLGKVYRGAAFWTPTKEYFREVVGLLEDKGIRCFIQGEMPSDTGADPLLCHGRRNLPAEDGGRSRIP